MSRRNVQVVDKVYGATLSDYTEEVIAKVNSARADMQIIFREDSDTPDLMATERDVLWAIILELIKERALKKLPELVGPEIDAWAHSDDRVYDVAFDARAWFMQATDEQIIAAADDDWENGYGTDEIAQYMADYHEELAKLFGYLEQIAGLRSKKDECGFSCGVGIDDAMAWLDDQRPALAAKIRGRQEEQ